MSASGRAAFASGLRAAFGVPMAVLGASYIGFGALAGSYGASVWAIMFSTASIWALPGQLVIIEMWQVGAPMIAVILAATLANARFLPMGLTLMPVLRDPSYSNIRYFAAAHFVAMTAWAVCMRRCPEMPSHERLPWFTGFSVGCMTAGTVCGGLGYLIASSISPGVQLGLVFMTTVYFFVILIGDVQSRLAAIALACGAAAGPLWYLLTPQWSVLVGGFTGGTAAYLILRVLKRRHA